MQSIKDEVNSLILLAIIMVVIILVVQTFFGIILYRMIIMPIANLSKGAMKVAEGDLNIKVPLTNKKDSIYQLITNFNDMVTSLGEKTTKLTSTISELERRDKRLQDDLTMAQDIQQGIMPRGFSNQLIDTSVYFEPMEKVSGDYYDFFELPDNSTGILITDISGHGMPAALVSMMAKIHFNEQALLHREPAKLFEVVNNILAEAIPTAEYLTAIYIVIDKNKKIQLSSAAHPAMIYINTLGEIKTVATKGTFIGAFTGKVEYETTELQLKQGEKLILYTDGISEAENAVGEVFGLDRLLKIVSLYHKLNCHDLNNKITSEIKTFIGDLENKDDITLAVIEIK